MLLTFVLLTKDHNHKKLTFFMPVRNYSCLYVGQAAFIQDGSYYLCHWKLFIMTLKPSCLLPRAKESYIHFQYSGDYISHLL
jgi:hypothetical protein